MATRSPVPPKDRGYMKRAGEKSRLLSKCWYPTGTRTIPAAGSGTPISKTGAAGSAALPADLAPGPARVVAAWPIIGERGKATILGIARAAVRKARASKAAEK